MVHEGNLAWELKIKERDVRIAQLESMVVEQQEKIEQLQASLGAGENGDSLQDEVVQLRAIVEAQEEALADQRSIIASQSGLLDELNNHLQLQSSSAISENAIEEDDEAVVTPTGSSAGAAAGSRSAGSTATASVSTAGGSASMSSLRATPSGAGGAPASAQGAGPRVSRTSGTGSEPGPRRRREGLGQRQAATHPGGSSTGRGNNADRLNNARSHREQLLAQKLLSRQGNSSTTAVEHPRAPRPNSALGRGSGATPRARSWTERSGASGTTHSARGPSPTRGTEASGGLHARKSGGPLPPALPLLRQEA